MSESISCNYNNVIDIMLNINHGFKTSHQLKPLKHGHNKINDAKLEALDTEEHTEYAKSMTATMKKYNPEISTAGFVDSTFCGLKKLAPQ